MNRFSVKAVLVAVITLLPLADTGADDNTLDRVRRHKPKMSYLDNGVIRLGIDLNLGDEDFLESKSAAFELTSDEECFRRCEMIGNGLDAVTRPAAYSALEFSDCQVRGNQRDQLPDAKSFAVGLHLRH